MLTAEQLELRKTTIGASEIASIAGVNPWKSAHDVWMDKMGYTEGVENLRTRAGELAEPAILAQYCEELGVEIERPGTIIHPTEPWMSATPDGLVIGQSVSVEAKFVGFHAVLAGHWGTGPEDVPAYYRAQGEWQCEVTGRDEAHFPVWLGGPDFKIYIVKRDREMGAMFKEIGRKFYKEHILTREQPPVDASQGARRMLEKLYPVNQRKEVPADGDVDQLGVTLGDVRKQLAQMEKKRSELENKLIERIKDADGIIGDTWRATFRANKNGKRSFRFLQKGEAA